MRKFSQINESEKHPYTWDELLYRLESGEIKVRGRDKEEYIEMIKANMTEMSKRDPDINTSPIVDPKRIHNGIAEVYDYLIVFDDNLAPVAILDEYEMMNPFVFGDVVIVPGRDSITCYNKLTREIKRAHIR